MTLKVPTSLKNFLLDLLDKRANEPALQGSVNVKTITELILGTIVPCIALVNSFTPLPATVMRS